MLKPSTDTIAAATALAALVLEHAEYQAEQLYGNKPLQRDFVVATALAMATGMTVGDITAGGNGPLRKRLLDAILKTVRDMAQGARDATRDDGVIAAVRAVRGTMPQ